MGSALDALYAALGALGASALLQIDPVRIGLGLVGAAVLAALGLRTLWSAFRVRLGAEKPAEVASPRRAFLTSLGATPRAAALVLGVGMGTLTWFTALSAALALGRRRAGPRVLIAVDGVSGSALLGFATLLAYRTLQAET